MNAYLRLAAMITLAPLVSCSDAICCQAPSPEQLAELADIQARFDAVDRKYPPAATPKEAQRFKAKRLSSTGDLFLTDGRALLLDGITCTAAGYDYLSRLFLDQDVSLLVAETGTPGAGGTPAEVWVETQLASGTSISFPFETAIISGWCDARKSSTSPHNDRFAALEIAFAAERMAYKASAP